MSYALCLSVPIRLLWGFQRDANCGSVWRGLESGFWCDFCTADSNLWFFVAESHEEAQEGKDTDDKDGQHIPENEKAV